MKLFKKKQLAVFFSESVQNNTIEERVSLLEIQVSDLREDVTVVQGGVVELDQDVDFLFGEQLIQDERLLELEQTSVEVVVELAEINENIQGISHSLFRQNETKQNIMNS